MGLSSLESILVTVVMPVYNGESYLRMAIESILNQTHKNIEFIILDDGSTDCSLEILRGYARDDKRISLIYRENRGVVATRNELLGLASGTFIAWMDQDDISHPDRLSKQLAKMVSENIDICGCHWMTINANGKLTDARLAPLEKDSFINCLAYSVPFAHGSVMIRKDFQRAHRLMYGKAKYAEDYGLWIDFFDAGARFGNVNEFLFNYRELPSSFSKRTYSQNLDESKRLRRNFVKKNFNICLEAISTSLLRYHDLSEIEKVYLFIASYLISLRGRKLIFLNVIRQSSHKSLGLFLLYFLRRI